MEFLNVKKQKGINKVLKQKRIKKLPKFDDVID